MTIKLMKLPFERPRGDQISIKTTAKDINFWAVSDFISEQMRKKVVRANVLLVPDQDHMGQHDRVFPDKTFDFFHYLRTNAPTEIVVEACIDDEDYKELALHQDLLILAEVVTTVLIAPIVVNLISEYITTKLKSRVKKTDVKTKLTVVFERNRQTVEISYDGPAADFKEIVNGTLEKLTSYSEGDDFAAKVEEAKTRLAAIPSEKSEITKTTKKQKHKR